MNTLDTEPKPYGTRNDVDTRNQFSERRDVKVEPYATSNVTPSQSTEVHPNLPREATVKTTVYTQHAEAPQQQHYQTTQQSRVQRRVTQYDIDQLKNPVVATILGLSLALLLLSLTHMLPSLHMPHLFGRSQDKSVDRSYDNYAWQRHGGQDQQWMEDHPQRRSWFGWGRKNQDYSDEHPQRRSWFGWGRNRDSDNDYSYSRKQERYFERPSEMVEDARDRASGVYERMKEPFENMYDNAKDTAESAYYRAKEYLPGQGYQTRGGGRDDYPGWSSIRNFKDEAAHQACQTAERAAEYACGFDQPQQQSNSWFGGRGSWFRGRSNSERMYDDARSTGNRMYYNARDAGDRSYENARYAKDRAYHDARYAGNRAQETAEDVQYRAQNLYEAAKQRAADALNMAKDTVTYPVNVAKDVVNSAKDTVVNSKEQAKDTASSSIYNAKDTVAGAAQAVRDTVMGAGEAVRNAASSTIQTVKDHTPDLTGHTTTETCTGENCNIRNPRAQVKVEVREL
jgi:hypothetical protein